MNSSRTRRTDQRSVQAWDKANPTWCRPRLRGANWPDLKTPARAGLETRASRRPVLQAPRRARDARGRGTDRRTAPGAEPRRRRVRRLEPAPCAPFRRRRPQQRVDDRTLPGVASRLEERPSGRSRGFFGCWSIAMSGILARCLGATRRARQPEDRRAAGPVARPRGRVRGSPGVRSWLPGSSVSRGSGLVPPDRRPARPLQLDEYPVSRRVARRRTGALGRPRLPRALRRFHCCTPRPGVAWPIAKGPRHCAPPLLSRLVRTWYILWCIPLAVIEEDDAAEALSPRTHRIPLKGRAAGPPRSSEPLTRSSSSASRCARMVLWSESREITVE